MKTYILFFIVFLLSFSGYSQTGRGMRREGQAGTGRATGTQSIGAEAHGNGGISGVQGSAKGKSGKSKQGGSCNPGNDASGTSATGIRRGSSTGIGTRISQPNIRTNVRVNTGVRSF